MSLYGSSPRVRGTPVLLGLVPRLDRFIPACAGNTRMRSYSFSHSAVHPRVCGEHNSDGRNPSIPAGSSPRVRGTRSHRGGAASADRFIPACAGNTSTSSDTRTPNSVHPRVCGEHASCGLVSLQLNGSSPRVRGTHHLWRRVDQRTRFIPACAGNTGRSPFSASAGSVHPRVCGEHEPVCCLA